VRQFVGCRRLGFCSLTKAHRAEKWPSKAFRYGFGEIRGSGGSKLLDGLVGGTGCGVCSSQMSLVTVSRPQLSQSCRSRMRVMRTVMTLRGGRLAVDWEFPGLAWRHFPAGFLPHC
jgi:hypothetical protein